MKKCKTCKKPMDTVYSFKKYCSYDCAKIAASKKTRKKTSLKRSAETREDDAWAYEVKRRAGFKCEICGKTEGLNSHHIFTRSNKKMRHSPENGVCVCIYHHLWSKELSAHKAPIEFIEWLKDSRGEEWYNNLRFEAKTL